jgi:hypothetical protein
MSEAVTPSTFFASCSWVMPAPVRASLIKGPTLFAMAVASFFYFWFYDSIRTAVLQEKTGKTSDSPYQKP